ncbi:MAG: hypothetical protein NTZ74_15605 [Chloroflexi bacterium]|nr:hypothetical protein [Chloroflexota bacterium]
MVIGQTPKKVVWKKRTGFLLLAILLFALVLFILRIKKYGVGFDEYFFYQFAELNLHAIFSHIAGDPFDHLINFYDLKYYGPAYVIPGEFLIEKVRRIFPNLDIYHAWHILNFTTFLSGAWILYILSKRFVSEMASFFSSLLYLTQPLLWGHGIMNPKDIPFLVFFLAAVTVGIIAVDKIFDSVQNVDRKKKKLFLQYSNKKRRAVFLVAVLLIGVLVLVFSVDRISSNTISRPVVSQFFTKIEKSSSGSLLYSVRLIIDAGGSKGIPLSSYFDKAFRVINTIEFYFISLSILLMAFFLMIKASSASRWSVFAAFLLGLTMAIRILGPAAGGLVILYAIIRLGKKSWRFLLAYAGIAVLIMYLCWPRLWVDPINRYIEAFKVMANFPWPGPVRFESGEFLATQLPWYFLPKIISIQLTLPLLILAFIGLSIAVKDKLRVNNEWRKILIVILWFFIPFLTVILFRPAMYDNFRQFLFIIPPLFVFAGIGFEDISKLITKKFVLNGVFFVSLLPGIIAGIWLDPYEYVYYNGLVGWTGNVGRKYETDYWNTSFCEAAQYLSNNAQEGSQIAFTDSMAASIFMECAHKKFDIVVERVEYSQISPDYSIVSTRYDDDIDYFRTLQPLKIIKRGETPFLVIRSK